MKALILYYSHSGNTRRVAEMIQLKTGWDIAGIEPLTPYPEDYDSVVNQGKREVQQGFEPELKPLGVSLDSYDTIILGTPVWWYTFAPPVKSVLSAQRWAGRTIHSFATNGGGVGHIFEDLRKICAGAEFGECLNLRFDGNRMRTSEKELDRWIHQIYL